MPALRRAVPLLLVCGAVLGAAVLLWPTQHLVSRTAGGSVRLVDIWFAGRVRGVTESVSADADSSPGLVALLGGAVALLLAAGVIWVAAVARGWAALAAALAAAATAALTVAFARGGSASFGWMATGDMSAVEYEQTPVALLLPVAAALSLLALIAMLVVAWRVPARA